MEILALFLKNDAVEISSLGELLRYRIPDVNRLERMVRQERFETGPSERRTAGIHRKVAARELLDLLKEKRVIHREGVRGMIDQRKLEELLHIEKGRATAEALVEQFARGEIVPGAIYDQRIVYEMLMSCVRHYFQFPPFQAADLVFEQRAMQVLTKVTDPGLIDRDVFAEALTQVNVQLEQRGRPDFITTLSFREEREPARERGQKTVVNMKSGAAHLLEALERQKLIAPVKGQGPDSAMLATLQEQQDRTFVPPGVDADIFKGKTIGITGGSGYISAPLIQRYLDAGASQVVIMDNQIRNREEISQLEGVVIEDVDLADTKTLREIFQRHHFDHITHLAADIEAGVSMKRPAFYHWNNVLNTRRLLGVMKEFDIKGITFASSAGVYEGKAEPLDEDVNVNPQNVYGATKRMMEKMMRDFSKKNGIRFAALRFFNVAGAFEWEIDGKKVILGENHRGQETHIIPGIFEVLQGKRPYFMMFGGDYATRDGSNVRDYIHVLDLANAIVRAAAWTMVGGQQEDLILNLGTKKGTSNFEILEEVQKVTGKKFHRLQGRELEIMKGYVKEKKNAEVKQFADQMKEKYQVDAIYFVADRRSGDADSLTANPERAKEKLGWEAVHSDVNTVIGDAWKYHSQEQIANTPLAEAEEINIESTETAYLRDLVDEISGDSELSKDVQFEELFRVFIDSLYDAKFDATDRPHQLPIYNSARDILAKQQPVLQSVLEDAAFIKLLKDQPLAATQRGGALAQVRAELLDMLQEAEESDDLQAFIESFGSDAAMLGQALAGLAFIVAVAVPTILAIRNWKLKYTQKLRTGYFDLWESFQRQVEPYQLGAVARAELFNRAVRVWKDKGSFEVIERRNDSAGGPVLDVVSREEARGMENKDPAMLSGVFQKTILAPDRVTLAITVKDPEGLHMRPAGEIVRTAQAFDCEGTIKNGDVKAEITSIMQVSMLVALQGSVLIFDIHGERANDSVAKFAEILGWTPAEIKEAMPSEEQPSHESDRAMLAEMGEFVWMAPIWVGLGLMTTLALAPHAHLLTQAMRGSRERKEYPWLWDTFEKRLAQHPDSPVAGVHKIALFHQAVHLYRHGYNFILMEKPRALHPLRFELCVLKGDRLQSQWISMRELLGDAWPAHVYEEVERQLAPFNVGVTPQEKGQLYEQAFQIARAGMKFEIKLKRGSIPLAVEIVAVNPLTKEIISSGADRAMLAERTIRKIAEQVVGKNIVLSAGYTPERWNMFPYRWSEGDSIVGEPTHFSTIPLGVIELLQEAKGPDESFDESPRVALSWLSYEPADEMEMAGRGYELLTQGQFIKFLRALSDSEDGEVRSFIVKGFLPALQAQMQGVELELDSATQTVFVQRHVAEDEDGDDIASQIKEVRGLTSTHALRKRLKDSDLDPMVKREIRLQIRRLSRTWGPERQAAALAIKSVPNAPGGIDFNPALFDLEIKRDDKGVPLPIEMQSVPELNNIQGFVPVILEITPATNLPMLLGLMDDGEATEGLSLGSSDGTAIIEREKIFDRKRAAARRS
ncbi:MAG TPA: HPr family phosphocarrier protein, partial [Candidatus Bathyarchaeia archaeon]|nr:HPr family phosphocarrier protein [Candidatus Bathyarchaeia archaeon]